MRSPDSRCSAGERSNGVLYRDEPFHGQTAVSASLETANVAFAGSKYAREMLLGKPMRPSQQTQADTQTCRKLPALLLTSRKSFDRHALGGSFYT
jgi:hypothetical protein